MSVDVTYNDYHVCLNGAGWTKLCSLLKEHGFSGELPDCGMLTVTPQVAREVAKAMLQFYSEKRRNREHGDHRLPQLDCIECAAMAYALMLMVSDGNAEHW